MIVGQLAHIQSHALYPPVIQDVIEYLLTLDLNGLSLGKHFIPKFDHSELWIQSLSYETVELNTLRPEKHQHYSDLQIVISGQEKIGFAFLSHEQQFFEQYNQTRDIQYYQTDTVSLNYMTLNESDFCLFPPHVLHVTNLKVGITSKMVKKIVVKIHNNLLGLGT